MPFVDLSQGIPLGAGWIKVHFRMRPLKAGEPLVARIWSGNPANAVTIKGESGDVFVKLEVPQTLSYDRSPAVDLSLKVTAYKLADEGSVDPAGPEA